MRYSQCESRACFLLEWKGFRGSIHGSAQTKSSSTFKPASGFCFHGNKRNVLTLNKNRPWPTPTLQFLVSRAVEPELKFQAQAPTFKSFGSDSKTIWSIKNKKPLYRLYNSPTQQTVSWMGTQISGSSSSHPKFLGIQLYGPGFVQAFLYPCVLSLTRVLWTMCPSEINK